MKWMNEIRNGDAKMNRKLSIAGRMRSVRCRELLSSSEHRDSPIYPRPMVTYSPLKLIDLDFK